MRKLEKTGNCLILPTSENDGYGYVKLILKAGDTVLDTAYTRLCPPEKAEYELFLHTRCYAERGLQNLTLEIKEADSEWSVPAEKDLTEEKITAYEGYPYYADTVDAYREPLRPYVHFTSMRGWINDTNAPAYFDGTYHLYYQYEPGTLQPVWDNSQWGHAHSKDLYHWVEDAPVFRRQNAPSGSSFLRRETGGLCVCCQNRIYESHDGGYTFDYLCDNPTSGGDPKTFWDEEHGQYVCISLKSGSAYQISVSPDLLHWEITSVLEGYHECPDFFRLPLDGNGVKKWILVGGDLAYNIGSFDGRTFVPDPVDPERADAFVPVRENSREMRELCDRYNGVTVNEGFTDWRRFFAYAYQSFTNLPDGRIVRIGWLAEDYHWYGMPFNQCQSIPQDVTLRTTRYGGRLCMMPSPEISNVYRGDPVLVGAGEERTFSDCPAADITVRFAPDAEITVGPLCFDYLPERGTLRIRMRDMPDFRIPYPLQPEEKEITARVILDRCCAELFFGIGECYVPLRLVPSGDVIPVKCAVGASASVQPLGMMFE